VENGVVVAKHRKKVSRAVKRALKREAGNKCANPGCVNYRTHDHHIREWSVWETNDAEHMIAICPACHDAVHNGPLQITDDTIYRWKAIEREPTNRDLVYVEPSGTHMVALGSLGFTGVEGANLFEATRTNELSYRLRGQDIFLVNLKISTRSGRKLVEVVDGHVAYDVPKPIAYERVPGRLRVTAPPTPDLIPDWALRQVREHEPDYGKDSIVLLDVEVVEPGLVRVQGIWSYEPHVIVVTKQGLHLCEPALQRSICLMSVNTEAARPRSISVWQGPIGGHFFGFGSG
jgi:hypothetical protein